MANIPCEDYFEETLIVVPGRVKGSNPDSLRDRWGNFMYNMDLSALPGDEELGNQEGAWSLWDITSSFCAQIEDDRGTDFITVAIDNRVYVLDWTRHRDEFGHNAYAPIYRMLEFGPIPFNKDAVEGRGGYALNALKRFRELQWALKFAPQSGPQSVWRISVGEAGTPRETWRVGVLQTAQLMRALVAVKGRGFTVRLENASNDPVQIESWYASWDVLGKRLPASKRSL